MGTRSSIGMQHADGRIEHIYCHWDGYPSNNGRILLEHYPATQTVQALLNLGDLSSLGEEIGHQHDFDFRTKFYDKYKGGNLERMDADPEFQRLKRMCNAYKRDRRERGNLSARIHKTPEEWFDYRSDCEYFYLWRDGEWTFRPARDNDFGDFKPLTPADCEAP